MRFTWDPAKAEVNLRRHGVSFDEAVSVFGDPLARLRPDPRHSVGEERFVLLGVSSRGRLVAVMFTEVAPDLIRIISARNATAHERRDHEEEP